MPSGPLYFETCNVFLRIYVVEIIRRVYYARFNKSYKIISNKILEILIINIIKRGEKKLTLKSFFFFFFFF
ncbi:hypothetical protein PUN28_018067 [Cardiocondyla obscurior]|uniref:Uncharacterized protein n=1 Tax=Cardiocondyla obscurior TaxID=286306 RepID=A0AAW2ELJ3_9HYME